MTDFLTKLKNKITYSVNNLVDDPDANAYAASQAQQAPPQNQDTTTDPDDDPSKFSIIRFFKKLGKKLVEHSQNYASIVLSVLFASIIANEMIVYSVPIRVIFFIFVIIVCITFTPAFMVLAIYYGYKLLYSSYVYYYVEKNKQPTIPIFPTIYALLPVTTYKPSAPLLKFLLYLFTYPKTEEDLTHLENKMKEYDELLDKSFLYFKTLESDEVFVPLITKMKSSLKHMHDKPKEDATPAPPASPASTASLAPSAPSAPVEALVTDDSKPE